MKYLVALAAFLSGKKTYITAGLGYLGAFAVAKGWITPDTKSQAVKELAELGQNGFAFVMSLQSTIAVFQRLATAKAAPQQ